MPKDRDYLDRLFDHFIDRMEGDFATDDASILRRMKNVGLLTEDEVDIMMRRRNSPQRNNE